MGKTNDAKARILKSILPISTYLSINVKALGRRMKNKVGPMNSPTNEKVQFLLMSDGLDHIGRRDHEYMQARRAILSSYRLSDRSSLKMKVERTLKEVCREVVGSMRAYRFTISCPWNPDRVLAFRCFLPHFKLPNKLRGDRI